MISTQPQALSGLHQIMNDVSSRLDQQGAAKPVFARPEKLDELGAFALLDPLLADLRKQYLDARQNRLSAQSEFGMDDPMCEVAALMEDSAWCAMQTRYMEVRGDRALMQQAQTLMEEDRRAAERAEQEQDQREKIQAYHMLEQWLRIQAMDRKRQEEFWLFLLLLAVMGADRSSGYVSYGPAYHFNRYAA